MSRVLTERGRLLLVRATPKSYQLVSEVTLKGPGGERLVEGPAWNAPALSRGLLYLRGKDRIVCLNLRP